MCSGISLEYISVALGLTEFSFYRLSIRLLPFRQSRIRIRFSESTKVLPRAISKRHTTDRRKSTTRTPTRNQTPKISLRRLKPLTSSFLIPRREKTTTDLAHPPLIRMAASIQVPRVETRFLVQVVSVALADLEDLEVAFPGVDLGVLRISTLRTCSVLLQVAHAVLGGADEAHSRKSWWVKTSRSKPAFRSWRPQRVHREISSALL